MAADADRTTLSLQRLYDADELDKESREALEAPAVRRAIEHGLGERSTANELLLATLLIDDSASVAPNIAEIRDGHNTMLEALEDDDISADVRVQTRALNRGVISPYKSIGQAGRLDTYNFSGGQLSSEGTPLYEQSVITLGTVMVKAREEQDRGTDVRTFTLILTDAENRWKPDFTARHVQLITTDMLKFATNHIVAGMGVGERDGISFHKVFEEMGIPRRWIFTSGSSAEEIKREFERVVKDLRLVGTQAGFRQLVRKTSS